MSINLEVGNRTRKALLLEFQNLERFQEELAKSTNSSQLTTQRELINETIRSIGMLSEILNSRSAHLTR
jgi:hypothetical protein